jgi:endonuclease G
LQAAKKNSFCLGSCPKVQSGNLYVEHDIFSLSNNPKTKFADWAAYKLTPESIGPSQARIWKADPKLHESDTLQPLDYEGASEALKIDRGHQVPLANFTGTAYWKNTNYLSNITPQDSELNQGIWKKLEDLERDITLSRKQSTWVLTGPVYEYFYGELPKTDKPHTIPSGYWKIIMIKDGRETKVGGFFFEQTDGKDKDICQHFASIAELNKKSGLNLLKDIPSEERDENNDIKELIGCS